jgi:alpha-1,2-mannosyltransferase
MYANTLACAYAFVPPSNPNGRRTLVATLLFATGAIIGWPFAIAVAAPFVMEELFINGGDHVPTNARGSWLINRWRRLLLCGAAAAQIAVRISPDE